MGPRSPQETIVGRVSVHDLEGDGKIVGTNQDCQINLPYHYSSRAIEIFYDQGDEAFHL